VKPAPFEYFEPTSLEAAVGLLVEHGEGAKLLAGGQSLVPLLAFRLVRPACLVDLNRIGGLAAIEERDGGLAIGAMTRQRALERSALVRARAPLLHEAVRLIGHPQIRTRGTVGGSLAHADPAAELPAVVTALDATLVAQGPTGRRELAARDFFRSYLTTALAPAEVLVEVRLPAGSPRTGGACLEVSRRPGDFALVGLVAVVTLDAGDVCRQARLVFFGAGPVPTVAARAERELVGQPIGEGTLARAAAAASEELSPDSDIHATADYRRRVGGVLVREVTARRDPPEYADGHYRDALALADELRMRPLVAHCHLGLGKLYRRTGKREEAHEHLTTATGLYREMDMRFWLEQAEAELVGEK
jgi:carbon-monoxide dehydrogenase medium subunit